MELPSQHDLHWKCSVYEHGYPGYIFSGALFPFGYNVFSIALQFSKILNYIQWERAKVVAFVIFVGMWT